MTKLQFAIVATDILLLRNRRGVIEAATQPVHRPPHYTNISGYIGGILMPNETGEHAARRIIKEKAGLDPKHIFFTPLKFYDRIDRDKRGRVVSIAFIGIMDHVVETKGTIWVPARTLGRLAYDHEEMRDDMLSYMKNHLFTTNIALHFMPKEFTIAALKEVYEYLLGKSVDKRNFYKFVEELPIRATKELTKEGRGRPAALYKKLPTKDLFLS